jgi:flavin-dependent dehydrogenase
MNPVELIDILIIGSGPAGMSTALHLVRTDPTWAEQMVVIDKAIHPREKLCGGGITRLGANVLAGLGLSIEPPNFPVKQVRLVYRNISFAIYDDPVFWVVRRDEFDHWLAQQGQARGIRLRQGEAVKEVIPGQDYIEVITTRATFRAKAVVAADGSRSFVRQTLKWADNRRLARLLEVLTPEVAQQQAAFRDHVAVFDFSGMAAGLQGYYWDFPSLVNGQPFMNRGIFDSRIWPERPRPALKQELRQAMLSRERNLDNYQLKGHPIYWFDKNAEFARPRLILVGDAAGVDPLFGEGISFALGYGEVAAAALVDAFNRQDFSFADYRQRILTHPLLGQLPARAWIAGLVYRFNAAWLIALGWRLAPLFIRILTWHNARSVPVQQPRLKRIS